MPPYSMQNRTVFGWTRGVNQFTSIQKIVHEDSAGIGGGAERGGGRETQDSEGGPYLFLRTCEPDLISRHQDTDIGLQGRERR